MGDSLFCRMEALQRSEVAVLQPWKCKDLAVDLVHLLPFHRETGQVAIEGNRLVETGDVQGYEVEPG